MRSLAYPSKIRMSRAQPEWFKPAGASRGPIPHLPPGLIHLSGIRVNNSMKLGELVDLIPQSGNLLRWYTCGPTVYDSAHLGHARSLHFSLNCSYS